jgi:hypothetical protein
MPTTAQVRQERENAAIFCACCVDTVRTLTNCGRVRTAQRIKNFCPKERQRRNNIKAQIVSAKIAPCRNHHLMRYKPLDISLEPSAQIHMPVDPQRTLGSRQESKTVILSAVSISAVCLNQRSFFWGINVAHNLPGGPRMTTVMLKIPSQISVIVAKG